MNKSLTMSRQLNVELLDASLGEFYRNQVAGEDAGIDLFIPEDQVIPARTTSIKVALRIKTKCVKADGGTCAYTLHPRSSMGARTTLRLSNSTGIIDAGYRGEIMAFVDNIGDEPWTLRRGDRLFQLCAPDLEPMGVCLVDEIGDSKRGEAGFGSTGGVSTND